MRVGPTRTDFLRCQAAAALLSLLVLSPSFAQHSKPAAPAETAAAQKDPAEVALAAAQAALDRRDYPAATTLLENFLFEHPGDVRGLFQLAYAYSLAGRTADAIDMYQQALEVDPTLFPARLNLGLLLLDQEQPDAAAAELARAAKLKPEHARAHLYLGTALERAGRSDEAREHFRRAAELAPADPEPRRARLDLLLEKNDWAAASPVVEELLVLEPDSPELLRLRADLLLRAEKRDLARAAYEDYLRIKPDDADAHLLLGRLYREDGQLEDALCHFQAAEQAGATAGVTERAATLLALERWEDAIPLYRQAVGRAPGDAELHASLGYALYKSKHFQDAVPELAEALRLDPKRVETYNHLAGALTLTGNLAGAIRALDARAAHAPETPGTLFLRGRNYDKLQQCGPAIDYYEKFLALNAGQQNDSYFIATGRLHLLKNVCRERKR